MIEFERTETEETTTKAADTSENSGKTVGKREKQRKVLRGLVCMSTVGIGVMLVAILATAGAGILTLCLASIFVGVVTGAGICLALFWDS